MPRRMAYTTQSTTEEPSPWPRFALPHRRAALHSPAFVTMLRDFGHVVHKFRDPPHGRGGFFSWHAIDPHWRQWSTEQCRDALNTKIAEASYRSDMDAMGWADACVVAGYVASVLHLEAGWFVSKGKPAYMKEAWPGEEAMLIISKREKASSGIRSRVAARAFSS
jgi:hypothetical protein